MMGDTVRAKRKRGRPRKDSNLCNAPTLPLPENSNFLRNQGGDQLIYPMQADAAKKCPDSDKLNCRSEEGMVYGVVEGCFDAGYLISVRIGNNLTPFRGVVFQPRKVVAVTAANDVAPQAKMYQRREIPVPPPKQAVVRPLLPPYGSDEMRSGKMVSNQFPYVHPSGNLRMVEEDEVMQAFEVSTSSGGSKSNLGAANQNIQEQQPNPNPNPNPNKVQMFQQDEMICRESMDQQLHEMNRTEAPQVRPTNLFQDVNFQENMFSSHHNSGEQESSPNLKLDLAFTVHKEKQMAVLNGMKNPNIGFHQALVAGNPLLLPPDLMGEPLEFMMDKPKTPPTSQETNMEVQSRLIHDTAAPSPYKLELATPQSARIADMDFVITNTMQQPAQSHTNN